MKTMELCLNFCIWHYLISIIDYKKNQSLKLNFISTKWATFKFHIQQFSHKCNLHFEIFQIKININRKANLTFIFFINLSCCHFEILWNFYRQIKIDKNAIKNLKYQIEIWSILFVSANSSTSTCMFQS